MNDKCILYNQRAIISLIVGTLISILFITDSPIIWALSDRFIFILLFFVPICFIISSVFSIFSLSVQKNTSGIILLIISILGFFIAGFIALYILALSNASWAH